MHDARRRGRWGEELAVRFLAAGGYRILDRNFRTRQGELDVVASRARRLYVVEVKAWRTRRFGPPEAHLGPQRLQRLRRVTGRYLADRKRRFAAIRFIFIFIHVGRGTLHLRLLRQV